MPLCWADCVLITTGHLAREAVKAPTVRLVTVWKSWLNCDLLVSWDTTVYPSKVARWLPVAPTEHPKASLAGPYSNPVSNTTQKSWEYTESVYKVKEATEASTAQPQSTCTRRTLTRLLLKWQKGYSNLTLLFSKLDALCNQRKKHTHEPAKHSIQTHSDGSIPLRVLGDLCRAQTNHKG